MYTILPVKKITPNDFTWVGRKVTALVPLLSVVSVPTGFVLTKALFEKYTEEMGAVPKIKLLLQNLDYTDTEKVQAVANEIQRMLVNREMPEMMKLEILDYYHTLNMDEHIPISELLENQEHPFVAVRSSPCDALDEKPEESEGLYMNLFNISGEEHLMKAIQACWASLFTAMALQTRNTHTITNASMAVFVQRMIDAERSSIVYSTHPENADAILMYGCYGLGEVLAAKMITPDEYIVKKETYELLSAKPQRQDFKLIKDMEQGKTVKVDLPEPQCMHQKFNEKQIIAVAKAAKKVEKQLGHPCKIECVLRGEDVYVLGVHPLRLLKPEQDQNISSNTVVEITNTTTILVCPHCKTQIRLQRS